MEQNSPKIIFIYNADSGLINGVKDFFHKIIKPQTYDCRLCFVSFGPFGMKKEWKEFVNGLPYSAEFLHRDEFLKEYPDIHAEFPSAYLYAENSLKIIISASEMNQIKTLEELIELTQRKSKRN